MDWFLPIKELKGVGDHVAVKLAKLNILTAGDLLLHCPFRYENRTQLTPIRDLKNGQTVLIQGEVVAVDEIRRQKKRVVIALKDASGVLHLVFFHYNASQRQTWQPGTHMRCYGVVKRQKSQWTMSHPEYELIYPNTPLPQTLTPVYPTVAGLVQGVIRKLVKQTLALYNQTTLQHADEGFPLNAYNTLSCQAALNLIHAPSSQENVEALHEKTHCAYQRLIAEELLTHQLSLKQVHQVAQKTIASALQLDDAQIQKFTQTLPFQLTRAQARVWQEIRQDLAKDQPMMRLVQGDVGCGKTIIAGLSTWCALSNQMQVAIMAPTEILAEQHAMQFKAWFEGFGIQVVLLNSKLKAKAKREILENIQLGLAQVVVGTHALFQDAVQFKNLGLAIIDEQHRFGVHQRLKLQQKASTVSAQHSAHQLIMTATPIPRTLSMSHYAHLDISVVDELPPGRTPVKTIAIAHQRRDEIISRIEEVCRQGQQVYWVCTLIEDSETLSCQAAQATFEYLSKALSFPVGLAHGKLLNDEKEAVMQAFYRNEISVLVATTVIEVGVNVPNATLMIIENPERLGLAQLHQLRGRVGRGQDHSYCVLLYQAPLSPMAKARINMMRETNDGFKIAEADLDLRGPGELLGTRQTGGVHYKIADYTRDKELIQTIHRQLPSIHLSQTYLQQLCKRWGIDMALVQA